MAVFAGYFVYDMSQAKHKAADACIRATQGMSLEDFLSNFSEKDYKIIRRAQYLTIVPKRGMGRNHCTVSHDGQKIIGSKIGFND
jgi:translation initiation factor RLI1